MAKQTRQARTKAAAKPSVAATPTADAPVSETAAADPPVDQAPAETPPVDAVTYVAEVQEAPADAPEPQPEAPVKNAPADIPADPEEQQWVEMKTGLSGPEFSLSPGDKRQFGVTEAGRLKDAGFARFCAPPEED
ncbi:hypothetical protein M527_07045 [Sphingobium indicum IP26]|uniref:Uncharacterized protein n=1 Tax=Sphingobium indicum F2 TaxID=1450518 RepID=A0A8E0WSL1_9SPHN|nr:MULTISPECIES: hypothetical protein [Sphingobium]EPR09877.1 hypothetical protein M527_07045 [Sphingobium indicum IP26]EQB05005.1 hypothetical protein L286_09560 [Sphingobium sp. HDIP04]KER36670.1 hypothetical protein AL00_09350 [Sphingobium indicum F2]